jgi:hypothetical protein
LGARSVIYVGGGEQALAGVEAGGLGADVYFGIDG